MSNIPPPNDGTNQPNPYRQPGYQPPTYQPQYGSQPQYGQAPPPPPQGPPTGFQPLAPRKRRKWPFIVGGVLALLITIGIFAPSADPATTAAPAPAATSAPPPVASEEPSEEPTEDESAEAPPPAPEPEPEEKFVPDYTCKGNAADEAEALSENSESETKIIKIYKIKTVKDRQKKFAEGDLKVPDDKLAVRILTCTGTAALSTGDSQKIEFYVEADDEGSAFIGYKGK